MRAFNVHNKTLLKAFLFLNVSKMINLHVHVFSVGREGGGKFKDRRRFTAAAKNLTINDEAHIHKEKS